VQGSYGGGDWNELVNFIDLLDNHIKFLNIPQNSPTANRYFGLFLQVLQVMYQNLFMT